MGYIDPGLFGVISQIGIAVGLVVVSAFAFLTKPLKRFFSKEDQTENETTEE